LGAIARVNQRAFNLDAIGISGQTKGSLSGYESDLGGGPVSSEKPKARAAKAIARVKQRKR
jgi:hypothetical protein